MLEIKIEGLDKIQRQLKEVERAANLIRGHLATLEFDPSDPKSKRAAIKKGEQIVDAKLRPYRNNPFVVQIIEGLKQGLKDAVNNHKP